MRYHTLEADIALIREAMQEVLEADAKATPGPWEEDLNTSMVYCDDILGSRVADCSTHGHGITNEQSKFDSSLIVLSRNYSPTAAATVLAMLPIVKLEDQFHPCSVFDPDPKCELCVASAAIRAEAENIRRLRGSKLQ